MKIEITNFDAFWKQNEGNLKENFAFVFGNGFPKSSPQLKDKNCFDISDEEYEDIWNTVNLRVSIFITLNKTRLDEKICPEELLNHMRHVYGIGIFKLYQKKQKFLADRRIKRPTEFLKKFKAIYTLNYDLFSYVSQFSPYPSPYSFSDGFSDEPIELKQIQMRQKESKLIPYYYLHGAFHIFQKPCCKKYEKIVSNGKFEEFPDKIIQKYNEIDAKLYECRPGQSAIDKLDNPIIVFSSRSTYKEGAIFDDEYLKYCLESLSEEKRIFTFGCSFNHDQHLLERILCANATKDKEIFIGFYSEESRKNIETMIKQYSKKIEGHLPKVTFVNVSDQQKDAINRHIWPDQ